MNRSHIYGECLRIRVNAICIWSGPRVRKPTEPWNSPSGRRCILTPNTPDAPFEVTTFDGSVTLERRTFNNHHGAAEFAIAEIREALASRADPQNG